MSMKVLCSNPVYKLFSASSTSEGSEGSTVYGIRALDPDTGMTCGEIDNVSDSEELVSSLITLFNENHLLLVHFQETVELLVGVLV